MIKTALVVDDDIEVQVLISEMLSQHGYICMGASSAEEAFAYGPDLRQVDVVFTDIKMPGMNGFELIAKLRKRKIDCPMIAVTGLPDRGHGLFNELQDKNLAHPNMVVAKPFSTKDVANVIELLNLKPSAAAQNKPVVLELSL